MKIRNQGFVTIQFLIAFMIVMFFVQAFLGLSLTLTHATLVQYISYSSARKLSLGGLSKDFQLQEAEDKYQSLRETFFKNNYQPGSQEWFEITQEPELGFNISYEDTPEQYRRMFYGVSVPFISRVFNFQIPFLTEGSKKDLKTTVASYLGRDPSKQECLLFFKQVQAKVCSKYGVSCSGSNTSSNNGC